jgi:hypothetical protein
MKKLLSLLDVLDSFPTIGLTPYDVEVYRRSALEFGLGAFYFFVSLVPSRLVLRPSTPYFSFLWVVEAIGFTADRQQGLKLLKSCVRNGGHKTPAAMLLLIW